MIGALVVESLAVGRGERLLFQELDLRVGAGEAVALVGRNGAGKTSLLRVIAGLIRPLAGSVSFSGAVGAIPAEDARSLDVHLVGHLDGLKTGRTAGEELLFQVRWTGGTLAGAEAACARLGLSRLRDLEVRKLSAGQRRRVAMARTVLTGAPLWLLDEPFTNLDVAAVGTLSGLIEEHVAAGGAALFTAHGTVTLKGGCRRLELA